MNGVIQPGNMFDNIVFGTDADKQRRLQSIYAQEICQMQVSYVDYLKDVVSFDNTDVNMEQELAYTNEIYNDMTFMLCFAPIRRGASCKGLLQTMGFYAASCLFSKTFRSNISDIVVSMFKPIVDDEVTKHPDSKWAKRKQYLEECDVVGTVPVTPEVFGMMHVAFCEQAYEAMRLPEADETRILQEYMLAEDKLYRQAKACGISSDVVDFYSNKIVQNITYQYPEKMIYFTELAYGNVVLHGNKYKYNDGPDYPYFFTPRRVESVNETLLMFSDACTHKLESAQSPDDVKKIVLSDDMKLLYDNYQHMIYDDNQMYNGNKSLTGSYYVDGLFGSYNFRAALGNYDMTQTCEDFLVNGPRRLDVKTNIDNFVVNYALGGWMYTHPAYDVVHYEQQAEYLYDNPPKNMSKSDIQYEICKALQKRDENLSMYYDLSAFMTNYFKKLEHDFVVKSNNDVDEMYFDVMQSEKIDDILNVLPESDVCSQHGIDNSVTRRLQILQSKFGNIVNNSDIEKNNVDVGFEQRV